MSHTPRPADAHDLLLNLERAIIDALGESLPSSATTFAGFDSSKLALAPTGASSGGANASALPRTALRARVEAMGSLPPTPPTVRGHVGKLLISFTNRLTWWQSTQAREVASGLVDSVEGVANQILDLDGRRQALDARVALVEAELSRLEALGAGVQTALERLERGIAAQSQIVTRVEVLERCLAEQEDREQIDEFYVSHQERFRGSREEIIERLRYYLPIIERTPVAQSRKLALDLGCGRGEWLQLLQEKSWPGRGLDTNVRSIEQCRSLNLDAVHADAVQYLTEIPDGELGAVTAFHVAEHLPFPKVIRLLRQAARSLASGGVVILETPNPANHRVATSSFYLDPSHVAPLPSGLLQVALEFTGFTDVHVAYLHPEERDEPELSTRTTDDLCRDYGIIGFRR